MVHTFRCLGRSFMLDVESGSVFETDELTNALIESAGQKMIECRNSPVSAMGDFSRYPAAEIEEAADEIRALFDEGVLFTPPPVYAKPVYHGVVKAMCLNISHNCNLSCAYCFAHGGSYNSEKNNMPSEVARAAIDFLIAKSGKRHNLEVDFFGGEPLLNIDVVKETVAYARSLEKAHDKKFKFTITTNALALTDELTDYFNREMYNVVVSIDGRESVHNSVRKTAGGKDSYDVVLKNALAFRKKRGDLQYYVRGTFTARNPDFSSDVLYLNDLGFDQISIEPVVLEEGNPLALKAEDMDRLEGEYERLAAAYIARRKTDKWFNFFHFMIDLENGPCEAKRLVGCGAGNEYVCVAPSGDIYPCHQFDGEQAYKIGNVLDGSFDTAIPERFSASNMTTKEGCPDCWAKYFCSGGCNANALHFNGDIDKPYKTACRLMKKRIECAIAINCIENN